NTTVYIADEIIEAFDGKDGLTGLAYYNDILDRHQKLGHKLAEAFANEQFKSFIDLFVKVVDTENADPIVITSTEAKAMGHAWEETCTTTPCDKACPASGLVTVGENGVVTPHTYTVTVDGNTVEYTCSVAEAHCVHYHYNLACDFYYGTATTPSAAEVVAVFEQNVLPYIKNPAGEVEFGYLQNVGKDYEGDANFVTLNKDNWAKFYNKVTDINLDINGATYMEYKAQMDAYMDSAILTGSMTYTQIVNMVNDMMGYGYAACKDLSNNATQQALFTEIFGEDGIKPYDDFINDLKRRAANRIYDLINQVYYYYDEGDGVMNNGAGKVAYHNFEAIIGAYSAVSGEAVPGTLLKFLNEKPAYNPDAEQFADSDVVVRTFTEVSEYYDSITSGNPSVVGAAEEYRDMLKQLRDNQGGADADNEIRDLLFDKWDNSANFASSTMYEYIWQSKAGTLDYSFVKEILDAVGVTGNARDLLAGAVDALDAMIISEDMGTLLGALLMGNKHKTKVNKETGITKYGYVGSSGSGPKKIFWIDDHTNPNAANLDGTSYQGYTLTAMTNSLGYWEYAYAYDHDGDPNTAKVTPSVGSECKNLKEWLVSTIISYLFSGELHTMLFKLLNEMVGSMIYDMAGRMAAVKAIGITAISEDDNSHYFPAFLRTTLATMPHLYTANSNYYGHGVGYDIEQTGVKFHKWFDGSIWGDDFSQILALCSQAPWVTQANDYSRTYWADGELKNYSRHKVVEGIPAEAWATLDSKTAWNIESFDEFYEALASATCGYQPILSGLITSDESNYVLKIKLLDAITLDGTIKFWASEDNIYDNLLVPLYEILGITGYPTAAQIISAGAIQGKYEDTSYIKNNGKDLWSLLLSPIVNWLDTKLLANPVEEILNLLPNLLAALEYNQLFPKIQNIILSFNYKLVVIGIQAANSTDAIKLSQDTILPLIEGVDLKHGFTGLLESLSKITRMSASDAPPKNDDGTDNLTGYLTTTDKNEKGEVLYYDFNEATYTYSNPTTENNEAGTKVTKTVAYRDKSGNYYLATGMLAQTLFGLFGEAVFNGGYKAKNGVYTLSLTAPINRLMAMCTMKSGYPKTVPVVKDTLTIYHLEAAPGDILLVLLRWIMNDGVLTTVGKLLGAEGTLGTILGALTGQADNIAGILVSLLNEYSPALYQYVDTYSEGQLNWDNKNNGSPNGEFILGEYLDASLSAGATADEYEGREIEKANLAIQNVDNLINEVLPTVLTLLKDTLDGFLDKPLELLGTQIDLGFVKDILYADNVTLAGAVADVVSSNELMQVVAELLFGDGEATVTKNEDGTETTTYNHGLLGNILSGESIAKFLPVFADYGIDISPYAFYNNTKAGGTFANAGIANWLSAQGANNANASWADIIAPAEGYNWYPNLAANATNEQKVDAFFALLSDLLSPLNSILSLLLFGEDLTFFDRLTLEGGNGYQAGLVLILEALGVGDVQLPGGTTYQTVSSDRSEYLTYMFGTTAPAKGQNGNRNWVFKNSPLMPLLTGLRAFLVGDDTAGVTGLLESPLTVLLEKIPNIAYMMVSYELVENGETIKTSNLAQAVKNLASPALKILDIIDPVLSKILELDIAELIAEFLDFETTINSAISKALAKEEIGGTGVNISSFIDFGSLAVLGGTRDTYTSNVDPLTTKGGMSAFSTFEGNAAQTFITLVRGIMNDDILKLLGDMFDNFIASGGVDGTGPSVEERVRIKDIATGLINRFKTAATKDSNYNGTSVDIILGIIFDLFTDYVPGDSVDMFYVTLGNALEDANNNIALIETYGVESTGYEGWTTDAQGNKVIKDSEGNVLFTQAEVNDTMDSLDNVIAKALPDVLKILTATGTLDLSKLGVEVTSGTSLFEILSALVGDLVFTDKMMTTIYDLLMGIFGSGVGDFRDIAKDAGFDFTAKTLYLATGEDAIGAGLRAYMSYNLDIEDDGTVDGEDLTWPMIKKAHEIKSYKYDENGNVLRNDDGTAKYDYAQKQETTGEGETLKYVYTYETATGVKEIALDKAGETKTTIDDVEYKLTAKMVGDTDKPVTEYVSLYDQEKKDGKYLYTYTNANGETVEYTSDIANLKSFAIKTGTEKDDDGNEVDVYTKYSLTPVYDETTAKWTFSFQTGEGSFYENVDIFISALWDFISQMEDVLVGLFFGKTTNTAIKAFNILNIEGQDTYADTLLPLLRAFGLDAILKYLDTNYVLDEEGNATTTTYLAALNAKRGEKYGAAEIPNKLIATNAEMQTAMGTTGNEYDMEKFLQIVVNYVFYFVEILAEYPIATIANMLPTLAYFIVGDGLNEIVTNLLSFVMVFIKRLGPVLSVEVNELGAGLIDYLGTKTWTTFQEIFNYYNSKNAYQYNGVTYPVGTKTFDEIHKDDNGNYIYDENGKLVVTQVPAAVNNIRLTEALLSFVANIKIDMAGIYKVEGPYYRTITAFIDGEVENAAWDLINKNTVNGVTD
ncbi:MAG: hypothetical protein J6V06_00290, partial [Clostridia bacterium]|nr:hypothetical protein [Clostridia bacterium]